MRKLQAKYWLILRRSLIEKNKLKRIKNRILRLIYCLIFFLALTSSYAQQPMVKSFDIRSENTRPRIVKLIRDHNGRIWTGTDKGIFTFDGINFKKIFSPDSGVTLVSALFEDKESCIWAGFENGKIICLKNQSLMLLPNMEVISKVGISGFIEDKDGRIFIATKGQGIYYIENNKLYNINQDDGMSDDYCYCIVQLPDGRMCVGTDAGINFFKVKNGKKIVNDFGTSNGLPDDIVRALVPDNR